MTRPISLTPTELLLGSQAGRQASQPPADASTLDVLDALFQLTAACAVGHIRWPENSRGHREARHALKRARDVLQRSRYRVHVREFGEMAPQAKMEMEEGGEGEATP